MPRGSISISGLTGTVIYQLSVYENQVELGPAEGLMCGLRMGGAWGLGR